MNSAAIADYNVKWGVDMSRVIA